MSKEIAHALLRIAPFLVLLAAVAIAVKKGRFTLADLSLRKPRSIRLALIWWCAFLAYAVSTELALYKYGILQVDPWVLPAVPSAIMICGIVLLAPAAEELFFRGILLFKLTRWNVNKHLAILTQALVFVALHSFTYQNSLSSRIGIAQTLFDAIVYAYAMYSTGSIFTPMAMHATGNLIAIIERFILH